jgi:antitoxin (DNA-binding transcriptional repressor) of toxin-antitoxin stability system
MCTLEITMKATILDLRRRMPEMLRALDRHERVTIFCRGKERAVLVPSGAKQGKRRVSTHAAFGMWADRDDLTNVASHVRTLRKGSGHAL